MQPTDPVRPTAPEWSVDDPRPGRAQSFVSAYTIALIVGTCVILYVAEALFLPLTLAMLFAFILTPVVNFLCRCGLHDTMAVVVTVVAAAAVAGAFLLIIAFQLGQIGANLPKYQDNVLGKIDALLAAGNDNSIVTHLQFMFENISNRLGTLATPDDVPAEAPKVEVVEPVTLKDWLTGIILPALRPIGVFGLISVLVIFALLERGALRDRLVQLIGGSNILATSQLLAEAGARVSTYLLAQVLVNIIYAVPIWLGLWLIGTPNALFFGIVTLVARFLPYVGAFISALLPILMAFAVSPDWSLVLWTAGLFLVVEFVTSNAIEPWFYGHRTGLSPLAVIVSAMFWTWLWGPLGLFLATPLTVCLVVMGHHVPSLRLFSILLGDKPVLEESARLYDRLLTGRAFAATELATATAGKRSLLSYYNRNLIPALMLADADHEAGLLTDLQVSRIAHATLVLMHDLESIVEDDPDQPAAEETGQLRLSANLAALGNRVVVLGARTRLDEAAATLLGRELAASGVDTTVLANAGGIVERLRDTDPSAIVIASLGAGNRRVLGLQLRQLRRWFPKARVVIAVWPGRQRAEDAALASEDYILVGEEDPVDAAAGG